jgi:AraC family transcriptional regulator of adaptative response/methylated-DNA-[protein]-cysteine methyltransferase
MTDYERIEQAIRYLRTNAHRRPTLADIAHSVHLSTFHFQRLFTRWAGVSPKRFLQYLTIERAKNVLKKSPSLLDASFAAGLSGEGRLHDLFVTLEAMTPGEFKRGGKGLEVTYGYHPTPFGECLVAQTRRGVCALRFLAPSRRRDALDDVRQEWPHATFRYDQRSTGGTIDSIFGHHRQKRTVRILVRGTNFQIKVWRALLEIAPGGTVSYGALAARAGNPRGARPVGSALAANPIAYLIPCHRVIRGNGDTGHYRWGADRKHALLAWEASRPARFARRSS